MVLAPYEDLLKAASYRSITNMQVRQCTRQVHLMGQENTSLRSAIASQKVATDNATAEADLFRARYREAVSDLVQCNNRARKPNLQGILMGAGIGLVTGALLFTLAP
jgi:hypothetical protein